MDTQAQLTQEEVNTINHVNQINAERKSLAIMAAEASGGLLTIKTREVAVSTELPEVKSIYYSLEFTVAGKNYTIYIEEQYARTPSYIRRKSNGYKYRWNPDHNERQVWLTNPDKVVEKVKEFIKRKEDEVARKNNAAKKEIEMLAAARLQYLTAQSIVWESVHSCRRLIAKFEHGKLTLTDRIVNNEMVLVATGAEPHMTLDQQITFVLTGRALP